MSLGIIDSTDLLIGAVIILIIFVAGIGYLIFRPMNQNVGDSQDESDRLKNKPPDKDIPTPRRLPKKEEILGPV